MIVTGARGSGKTVLVKELDSLCKEVGARLRSACMRLPPTYLRGWALLGTPFYPSHFVAWPTWLRRARWKPPRLRRVGRQAGLIVLDNNNKEEIQGNKVLYAGRLARVALPCTRRSFSV